MQEEKKKQHHTLFLSIARIPSRITKIKFLSIYLSRNKFKQILVHLNILFYFLCITCVYVFVIREIGLEWVIIRSTPPIASEMLRSLVNCI
jgi:hypothetical protein